MKKKIVQFITAGICMFISFASYSQQNDRSMPAWVSEKGYWVIEGNVHHPLQNIVRFYNNQHVMTGMAEINTKKLNVKRKKVKMQLKSMLETSVQTWASRQAVSGDSNLVSKP